MVTCRLLTPADLTALAAVLSALRPTDLTPERAQTFAAERDRQGLQTFVAERAGALVGTASLWVEPKLLHGGSYVGHIEDVAVLPAAQGQGVGDQLLRYVLDQARAQGCYKVILDCAPQVVPFYARLGFVPGAVQLRWEPGSEF